LLLLLSLSSSLRSTAPSSERVEDPAFAAAAADVCARANEGALAHFRAEGTEGKADRAALARGVDGLADDLRDVDVELAPAESTKVTRWIDAWGRLADGLRGYDRAVARGDAPEAARSRDRTVEARTAINRFAYANGVTDCLAG
jgi:hypothetical protein